MVTPPLWVKQLANQVALTLQPVEVMSPLGCHFLQEGDHWEITLFASATEIVGGEQDGEQRASRFIVDVLAIQRLFDRVEGMEWQPLRIGAQDEAGAHLSVHGLFEGHSVWLRVLARPPKRFVAGRQARVYERSWQDTW